jgi:hypothetical protein
MDSVVAEKFCNNFNLTIEQIRIYEDFYNKSVLPIIGRHFLSHLVTTIEELINEKQKQAFLEYIRNTIDDKAGFDYATIEKAINRKIFRLFSIILVPVESGKLKARTHLIGGGHGVLITYWKQLPEDQIRILVAHELGHVAVRYLIDKDSASDDALATLFDYIALQDKDDFYKNKTKLFTNNNDIEIYNKIVNIGNRQGM